MTGSNPKLPTPAGRSRRSPPVQIKLKNIQANVPSFGSPGMNESIWREQLKAAFGTASDAFVAVSLRQLERAARIPSEGTSEDAINAAIAMIAAVKPVNETEAAMALQMACTHSVAMAVMGRIGGASGGPHRLPGLASATAKLIRAFATTAETLRRQRSGGDQHIRVEHVHVHDGGQAIVGAVGPRLLRHDEK